MAKSPSSSRPPPHDIEHEVRPEAASQSAVPLRRARIEPAALTAEAQGGRVPLLKTPNFDRVAAAGMQFTRAYAQSQVCGASRMCSYTGRYASSDDARRNNFPLRVGELTIGDHGQRQGILFRRSSMSLLDCAKSTVAKRM